MSVETVAPKVHPPIDPCPFCGDKGPEIDDFDGQGGDVFVYCGACSATGPSTRVGCRDDEYEAGVIDLEVEAITMWNLRGEHLEDEP